jgi:hypothetical protein
VRIVMTPTCGALTRIMPSGHSKRLPRGDGVS